MPGRSTPPMPDRLGPQWASSALTSVPSAWPGAGWTTMPGGLDQDDQVLVLEQDLELARLRGGRGGARGRQVEHEALARFDPVAGLRYHPLALAQVPFAHQRLQARARQLRQPQGQEQIEPLAVMLGRGA